MCRQWSAGRTCEVVWYAAEAGLASKARMPRHHRRQLQTGKVGETRDAWRQAKCHVVQQLCVQVLCLAGAGAAAFGAGGRRLAILAICHERTPDHSAAHKRCNASQRTQGRCARAARSRYYTDRVL